MKTLRNLINQIILLRICLKLVKSAFSLERFHSFTNLIETVLGFLYYCTSGVAKQAQKSL